MRYEKPTLLVAEQVEKLCGRGMDGDRAVMATCLANVSYYRLSAYWHPFRATDSNSFVDGTHFDRIWESYTFDRQLRLLDALKESN